MPTVEELDVAAPVSEQVEPTSKPAIKRTKEPQDRLKKKAQRASFAELRAKPRAEQEVEFDLGGVPRSILLRAVSAQEYDKIVTDNPPTTEQTAQGANWDIDTFAPDLLSHVIVEPKMTAAQWTEIWESDTWSRGEIMDLFMGCVELCNQGLQIPKSEKDSE